jgi:uncharacterized membrane protein YbhN (UPF0104 family)
MSALEATVACCILVLVDIVARAWRIQWIVQGLGHRIGFWDSFVLNAYGDAACALTPLRIGGEPARLAGMLQGRVPATAAFVAISLEVLAAWPVIIVAAGWVAWRYAPSWWAMAGPRLAEAAADAWPWVVLVTVLSLAVWWYARKVTSPAVRRIRRPVRRAMVYWRRMPVWPLLVSLPLSFLNLATRVAILPVLASTLPSPPELGPMVLGSFALLYSQMLLPTPSGAGAVELGFLGGAAGDLGARSTGRPTKAAARSPAVLNAPRRG